MTTSTVLGVGIIGTGMMGCEHIGNLKLTPQARVTALADPHEPSLAAALERLGPAAGGVEIHWGAGALLDAGAVDAVLIASPNVSHRAVLEPAFAAGVHILGEKPLCTRLGDARWGGMDVMSELGLWPAPSPLRTGRRPDRVDRRGASEGATGRGTEDAPIERQRHPGEALSTNRCTIRPSRHSLNWKDQSGDVRLRAGGLWRG